MKIIFCQPLAIAISLLISSFLHSAAFAQEGPQLNLQRIKISAGMHQIDTQLAMTPAERQIGLMNRPTMPAHEGMLFVFDEPTRQCFWMKNTLLPLTAAFVADDGTIVNLEDMKPQTLEAHCSTKAVRYVLEMNQGWFAKRGIKAGTKLSGVPFKQ
ncbi:MAG: DUF192 domain-containing protein [Burkholderiaceae bacterium]